MYDEDFLIPLTTATATAFRFTAGRRACEARRDSFDTADRRGPACCEARHPGRPAHTHSQYKLHIFSSVALLIRGEGVGGGLSLEAAVLRTVGSDILAESNESQKLAQWAPRSLIQVCRFGVYGVR